LFACFLVVWIPFYLIITSTLLFSSRRLTEKSINLTEKNLSYSATMLDNEFDQVTNMLHSLCVDRDTIAYMNYRLLPFNYNQYLSYLNVTQKMVLCKQLNQSIDDIVLLMPATEELFSLESGIYPLGEQADQILSYYRSTPQSDQYVLASDSHLLYTIKGINGVVMGANISIENLKQSIDLSSDLSSETPYGIFLADADLSCVLGSDANDPFIQEMFVQTQNLTEPTGTVKADGEKYFIIQTPATLGFYTIVCYYPERILYADVYKMQTLTIMLCLVALIVPALMTVFIRRLVHRPLRQLVDAMDLVSTGNYDVLLPVDDASECGYVFAQYNEMTRQLKTLIDEVLKHKVEMAQAQLRTLQARINPHFLFNSLYIGYRMAKAGETDKTADLCMYLGDYFKFITYLSSNDICIKDELNFIRTYLEINAIRFSERMTYEINAAPTLDDAIIPNLILQPLVENAIKHGVEKTTQPCHISVSLTQEGDQVHFVVHNTGAGLDEAQCRALREQLEQPESPDQHYGLWNINQRLRHLYGETAGLTFTSAIEDGFTIGFTLKIERKSPTPEERLFHV
ncbi:MAG: sensor histidine kinase, partial [Butyricicoccus sp.]